MSTINLGLPDLTKQKPRIMVFGVGGAGGNAVNNMITAGLQGCEFVVANTDAQALSLTKSERVIQMGVAVTEGLGAGSQPEVGRAAAEEVIDEITDHLEGFHMVFVTGGMGGGTGTGAAPVVARAARERGILTVGVVTKPFHFEGQRRMRIADAGIAELQKNVDTLIVIPNQNLFRIANERTTFADAFAMADQVLYSGVACITDLMVKDGLINLDFADVRSIMRGMGKAMMGTGEASGEKRAIQAAEAAIANPLLDETSMKGAKGLLISITGGKDLTLFEIDEAMTRIREEVDSEANIIFGSTFDDTLEGMIRVSVVATGIDKEQAAFQPETTDPRLTEITQRYRAPQAQAPAAPAAQPARATVPRAGNRTVDPARAALAAVEADLTPAPRAAADPAVTFAPYEPDPSLYEQPRHEAEQFDHDAHEPAAGPYIPPQAERPTTRVPRMPTVEDFPPIAQQGIRGQAAADPHQEDHRPRGLLRRIASGLVGREEAETEQAPAARQAQPQDYGRRPAARTAPDAQARPRGEYDAQGRAQPGPRAEDEQDEIPIPAFLRR
ncbi:cell division protein FtsZ [Segnochrobactraceae bacterium EtOH-i3]